MSVLEKEMSRFDQRLLESRVLPVTNLASELSFWCGNWPSETHCTKLCHGLEQEGHFSWDRGPQVSVQLKSPEL